MRELSSKGAVRLQIIWCCLFVAWSLTLPASAGGLRGQLEALSDKHDFQISGLEHLEDTAARDAEGELDRQLSLLLYGFNYIAVGTDEGRIAKVRILGSGTAIGQTRTVRVNTRKKGNQHYVDATIMGPRPQRQHITLMLDTGASMVILPSSLAPLLGYGEDDLQSRTLITGNGEIEGQVGKLRQLQVGQAFESNVDVAFVNDEKLGVRGLLGMAFLKFYRVTLDDARGLLILDK